MALKITFKPYEKIIIAAAVATNGGSGISLTIGNNVPILREKDILKEKNADSPARRIYFVVHSCIWMKSTLLFINSKDKIEGG